MVECPRCKKLDTDIANASSSRHKSPKPGYCMLCHNNGTPSKVSKALAAAYMLLIVDGEHPNGSDTEDMRIEFFTNGGG